MKICYVNPTVIIRRPIAELAHYFANKGNKIIIFTPINFSFSHENMAHVSLLKHKNITIQTYNTFQLPFSHFEWPIPINPLLYFKIRNLFKTQDAIQKWTYFYPVSILFGLASLFKRKATFILTMDTVPAQSIDMGFLNIFFKIYNSTMGRILFSLTDKNTIYSHKLNVPRSTVLTTGITPHKLGSFDKKIRAKFKGPIITFIGLMNPRKGADVLIEVAKKLPEVNFLMIGDGPKLKEYKLVAPKNVHFLGRRKDIHSIYSQSDVFVLPSRGEGLPGVVFEAMYHGLPVVASNVPCIDEQIDSGKGGYLVKKDDVEQFTKRISELLNDKEKRVKFGAYNKNKIKDFYWKNLEKEYLEIYNVRNNRI